MTIVGTLFGWLGDIVGTHVFTDGAVPQALRRRWNLIGFTVTDDEVNDWLTIQVASAGSTLTGAGGTIDASGGTLAQTSAALISLTAPSIGLDGIVTVNGRNVEASKVHYVRAVSTANLDLSGTETIDGVACVAGDVVLAAGQSTASACGMYVVAAGAWSRATDMDATAEIASGMLFVVSEGSTYADTIWMLTTNAPITLGSTDLVFEQVGGFNAQAATVNICTTSTGGVLNAGTRANLEVNVGTGLGCTTTIGNATSGQLQLLGSGTTAVGVEEWDMSASSSHTVTSPVSAITASTSHTVTSASVSHVVATWGITGSGAATQTCTTWGLTASGACSLSAASLAITTTGGALLNGTPIRLFWAVRAIADANVDLATPGATLDGVTMAANDLFAAVGQTTSTQCGIYVWNGGSVAATRVAGFDALAEYHLGTTVQAYEGTNAGEQWYLSALSSSLPATWTQVPSGGGGSSITDGTATLALASGSLSETGLVNAILDASGFIQLICATQMTLTTSTDFVVSATGQVQIASAAVGAGISITHGGGGFRTLSDGENAEVQGSEYAILAAPRASWSANSTSGSVPGVSNVPGWQWEETGSDNQIRGRFWTAVDTTPRATWLIGGTAASIAYAGPFTETVGSASRTVTASGANATHTCNGTYRVDTTNTYLFLDTLQATLSGYNAYVIAANEGGILGTSGARVSASSGPITMESSSRKATLANYLGNPRITLEFPAAATPTANTATAIGTCTVVASRTVRLRLEIHARVDLTNYTIWEADYFGNADGTTVAGDLVVNPTPLKQVGTVQGTGAAAPLASTDLTATEAGLVVTFLAANADDIPLSINIIGGQGGA